MVVPAIARLGHAGRLLVAMVMMSTPTLGVAQDPSVDFVREVRPILTARCFACHGPDAEAREADLSLVDFESATRELAPGIAAIVPGDPAASEVWLRITDPDDPMPPASAHDALDPEEIETIRRWIESGASYAPHWAYETPVRREPPGPPTDRDPIDSWIDHRLEDRGLEPSPRTDPTTLLRRLSLDLAGLPPTPDEVDAFLADDPRTRTTTAVDRLLASHHFGERFAIHWLDLVRYADTVGYHGDQEHNAWPYRDWVIRAFNDNLPFDRFTRMQLAGDLLPEPTQDDLVASAYNRLLQTTHEGGLQLDEYRVIYMVDRVRNASETWMGATLGCAQCHDHKYDPYTIRDFYAFGAFFADIDDEEHLRNPYNGYNTTPTRREPEMSVRTPAVEAELATIAVERASIAEARAERRSTLAAPDAAWESNLAAALAAGATRTETWVDDTLDTGGTTSGDWRFQEREGITAASGSRYRVQRADGRVQHYTVDTDRRIVVEPGSTLVSLVRFEEATAPDALMLQAHANASWEHRAVWGTDAIDYGRVAADRDLPAYRRRGALPAAGGWTRLEVPLEAIGLRPGDEIDGLAFTQHGGEVLWDAVTIEHPAAAPTSVAEAIATPPARRTDAMRDAIAEFRAVSDEAMLELERRDRDAVRHQRELESSLPVTVFTRTLETPREVRVLARGDWLDTGGEIVEPAAPAFLGRIESRHGSDRRADRLDLADWLTTPRTDGGVGELTARVFVNRVWAMFFGTGLCPSVEDFGGQGSPPEHLELLDELALDFMASGWDAKALVRRIVLTEAYARSSMPSPNAERLDPANLQFARQARPRLQAEIVRDVALAASGLLVDRVGGPSVKPPQPAGLYRHLNFPVRRYHPDTDDEQWRRGVYHHWQRQFLHPMLKAFDAPNREACTAQRSISNTPLAALVLMNDPVFVEAARAMATRLLAERPGGGADADRDRLELGWRLATARRPNAAELAVLASLLAEARRTFVDDPAAASALLGVGMHPLPASVVDAGPAAATELAAWTQACRAILNLHETYTRD